MVKEDGADEKKNNNNYYNNAMKYMNFVPLCDEVVLMNVRMVEEIEEEKYTNVILHD